jgi:hypothetical protein
MVGVRNRPELPGGGTRSTARRDRRHGLSHARQRWKCDRHRGCRLRNEGCKRNSSLLRQIRTSEALRCASTLTQGIRLGRCVACHERGRIRPSQEKPFDARVRLLRAFDSAVAWPAMSEAVFGRVEWRRRELNPRPEVTPIAASTCLSRGLISILMPNTSTLHQAPVVLISPSDQRPNQKASPLFRPARRGHPHCAETA